MLPVHCKGTAAASELFGNRAPRLQRGCSQIHLHSGNQHCNSAKAASATCTGEPGGSLGYTRRHPCALVITKALRHTCVHAHGHSARGDKPRQAHQECIPSQPADKMPASRATCADCQCLDGIVPNTNRYCTQTPHQPLHAFVTCPKAATAPHLLGRRPRCLRCCCCISTRTARNVAGLTADIDQPQHKCAQLLLSHCLPRSRRCSGASLTEWLQKRQLQQQIRQVPALPQQPCKVRCTAAQLQHNTTQHNTATAQHTSHCLTHSLSKVNRCDSLPIQT
jgi:hypothetical protein